MRVKQEARLAFEALADADGDEGALWGVVEGFATTLDACHLAVPEWALEFEQRFEEAVMAMTGTRPVFHVRTAVRGIRNVLIGLVGEPAAGKTCSALRLAKGLAGDGRVLLLDTEYGRPTEFAPQNGELVGGDFDPTNPLFDFDTVDLEPPFTPDRYRLALHAAAQAQPRVLIIDNISDEHFAMCEMADAAGAKAHGSNWREPRNQHRRMMRKLRLHPWYVILCVRTKEVLIDEPERGDKKGMLKAVCESSLASDCAVWQLVHAGGTPLRNPGVVSKWPHALAGHVPVNRPLDEAMGHLIAKWASPKGGWEDSET